VALVLVAFGLGLRLSVVRTPFYDDDLAQQTFLSTGESWFSFRNNLDLFCFFDGDRETARAKMSDGVYPWRFDDTQRLAYFRPVSSAWMWLDHGLFGEESLPAHLLSFAWFVLLVLVVRRVYRPLLPADANDLATLATLLSPISIITIKMWVGRYASVVATLAATGILFHLRWQKSGRPRDRWLSLAFLALGVFAGEIGIQAFAFVIVYTIVHRRGAPRRIARELWPLFVFLVVYMLSRTPLGYGVENSALYIDPLLEPVEFLAHVFANLDTILAGAVLSQVREGYVPAMPVWELLSLLGLLVFVFAALVRRLANRRDGAGLTRLLWLFGAAGMTLVFCFTSRRELRPWTFIIPQIAINALLALAVTSAWRRWRGSVTPGDAVMRAATGVLAVVWLVLPLQSHLDAKDASRSIRNRRSPGAMRARFPDDVRQAIGPDTTMVVFLRSPEQTLPRVFLQLWCGLETRPDLTTLTLSDNALVPLDDLVLTRTGANSLRLRSTEPFVRANDMYRYTERAPFEEGHTISLASVTVTVEEVAHWQGMHGDELQRLRSAEFAFKQSLDSENLVLLTWNQDRFELVAPPPVGQSIELR
jgi:hypothetical protein